MDKSEKVAYYYSELGGRDTVGPSSKSGLHVDNESTNKRLDDIASENIHRPQGSDSNVEQSSATNNGMSPLTHPAANTSSHTNSNISNNNNIIISNNNDPSRQARILTNQHQKLTSNAVQQPIKQIATPVVPSAANTTSSAVLQTSSQPQYLIKNSTSLSSAPQNQFSPAAFQSQMLSNPQFNTGHSGYHPGLSNNHQIPLQQQANHQAQQLPLSSLMSQQGQQNIDQELQRRQLALLAQQKTGQISIQSNVLNPSDMARLRRTSEPVRLGIDSINNDGVLENLNLDFETMLMNDAQSVISSNNNNNSNHNPSVNNANPMNTRMVLRDQMPANGNNVNLINSGSTSNSDYGQSQQSTIPVNYHHSHSHSHSHSNSKDGLYMIYNRSQDNIYEEIDNLRLTGGVMSGDSLSLHGDNWKKKSSKRFLGSSFTRWFSTRKKSMNHSSESDHYDAKISKMTRPPICFPEPPPENLTPEQIKRRRIVQTIVDSENSYISSLQWLITKFKKPLEEAEAEGAPILSKNKIQDIFLGLEKVLHIHTLFSCSLSECVEKWDEKEQIGQVFKEHFSKPFVLEIYSAFINNFTTAIETVRKASKSKAFAQFLHERSVSSPDRLGFFGSMVKTVQRFPHFILLLSDLLKHTPINHPDRMFLQSALTQLESLADRLNERKRDSERHFAVKQLLKDYLNDTTSHSHRYLLRQDDVCLLDMNSSSNVIMKTKCRKLFLLNDMLICVSASSNRLKFAVLLCDIDVIEDIAPATNNLIAHSVMGPMKEVALLPSPHTLSIEQMECERQSLVHDLELMVRIAAMVASLRYEYNGLSHTLPEQICVGIRDEIRRKEFQMTMIDRSFLRIRIRSKGHKNTLCVQFNSPDAKRDWMTDIRLTKLALDRDNNPGWENVPAQAVHQAPNNSSGHQRVPLFVKSLAIFGTSIQSQLTCALHYYLQQSPFDSPAGVLWICNVNQEASSLGSLATNGAELSLIHSYELSDSHVTCLEAVGSTLWIGIKQGRIIIIDANSPAEWKHFTTLDVQCEVTCIRYYGHFVYVGLTSGCVAVFDAINFDKPFMIQLSQSPVTCLLPINDEIFACSHNKIWVVKDTTVTKSIHVAMQNENEKPIITTLEQEPRPNLLAYYGSGLWVSLADSSVVKLYHIETLKHITDIDIDYSVRRVLNDMHRHGGMPVKVTSMLATRGLLWIGTNVGMVATLSLPRLQGVPSLSGGINIALHRFQGSVNLLLNLSAGSDCLPQSPQTRDPHIPKPDGPVKNEDVEAIYGQYADLMNVADYISAPGKRGSSDGNNADRMAWDLPTMNISTMNISDDSASTASSGAIYQEGSVHRGLRHPNSSTTHNAGPPQSSQSANQEFLQKRADTSNQGQSKYGTTTEAGCSMQKTSTTTADTNQLYESAQQPANQSTMSQLMSQSMHQHNIDNGALKYQTAQIPMKHQAQIRQQVGDQPSTSNYGSYPPQLEQGAQHQGCRIYDRSSQLQLQQQQQQQQLMQQARAATMISSAQFNQNSKNPYTQPSKNMSNNKTTLVMAGGNGYQPMAYSDGTSSDAAHCIIWEYKL